MKITTKQIAITALMLAICIISQFFKNTSVFITGPIINACLIITGLAAGMSAGIILSIITPLTAFWISGSPIMGAIPAIIPCVMAGNIIIVVCSCMFSKKIQSKAGLPVGLVVGSVAKALFMGVVISLILIPNLIPEKMLPKMSVFQMTFSVYQLITALIGSLLTWLIWLRLEGVVRKEQA